MYKFDWDPSKAASNLRKHGIDFNVAATVFKDSLMASILDEAHSDTEERWITVGVDKNGKIQVVSHTQRDVDDHVLIRIISARPATPNERRQYESGQ